MATSSVCAKLLAGQDNSCEAPDSRFFQSMVIINFEDLGETTITTTTDTVCKHNVSFALKAGKSGISFKMNENGSSVSGTFEKTNSDYGNPLYNHIVNLAVAGAGEDAKCILEALSKGRYVVALRFGDIVEVYGIKNGLSAGDFTYDPQANSGFTPLTLVSGDGKNESLTPLIYKSTPEGQEIEDYEALFKKTI